MDIPKDVTGAEAEYEYKVPALIKRKSDQISEETMQEVVGLIEHSVRPFILVAAVSFVQMRQMSSESL